MALFVKNPTSNTSPDPAQGGAAVTNPVNTGHDATFVSRVPVGTNTATCIWSGFAAVSGQSSSVVLKFDWSEDGTLLGSGSNQFLVQYSVNGGSSFSTALVHNNVVAVSSGSASTTIPVGAGDLGQVQVRDKLTATSGGPGNTASVTGGISNIRLEVTTVDATLLVMF